MTTLVLQRSRRLQIPTNVLGYMQGVQLGDSAARAMVRAGITTHDFGN